MKERHHLAVRTLVDVVLRSGDLDLRFAVPGRPLAGIRAHRYIQRQRPPGYRAEVPVSIDVETATMILTIGGRIDGILETETAIIVEEIKSTTRDPVMVAQAPDPCHWGQVKVYAYLYAQVHDLEAVTIQLTYCHLDTGETRELVQEMTYEALRAFFQSLIDRYVRWATTLTRWRALRNSAILTMDFPYDAYRTGQRDMAVTVYRTIRDGGQALIQAATGIGKTLAVLFPAIKSLGEGHTERIFFLTARNTGKISAVKALNMLQEKKLRLKRIVLTAKDRICFCPDATCNPESCTYARGHFDRLPAAIDDAFDRDNLDRESIEAVAQSHRVCPFEFSLELCRWADCIVCDYNYAFDPQVYLRRFFDEENGAYTFLVDEAHNLVDRSREMFSAQLRKGAFLDIRRAVKSDLPTLYREAGKINRWMRQAWQSACEANGFSSDDQPPHELLPLLHSFLRVSERWLAENQATPYREIVMQGYFDVSGFLRVWDRYDDSYVTNCQASGKDLTIKLFCLDPSRHLKSALKRCRAAIFFSATMTPADYFQTMLGLDTNATKLAIASPFPPEHLAVFIANGISTYYDQRYESVDGIVTLIQSFIRSKPGNYLCFFPSYAYMALVTDRFVKLAADVLCLIQARVMDDDGRVRFLDHFSVQNSPVVGFAVMGGIFGEGIDLVGDRLSGAVIVGVGLPAICPQRDLIRNYFDRGGVGFDFAYRFPGMNRVLQAAGRVIRTARDRGALLLIDQRFCTPGYRDLLPAHWSTIRVDTHRQLEMHIQRFWASAD